MQTNQTNAAGTIDGKTFAIGILSVTACVLFVGFLLVTMMPTPAYASGMNDRSGDYVLCTQQVSNSNEAIVVIDAAVKRMNLYGLNLGNRDFFLLQSNVDLSRLPVRVVADFALHRFGTHGMDAVFAWRAARLRQDARFSGEAEAAKEL